jgi:hypothetical protein
MVLSDILNTPHRARRLEQSIQHPSPASPASPMPSTPSSPTMARRPPAISTPTTLRRHPTRSENTSPSARQQMDHSDERSPAHVAEVLRSSTRQRNRSRREQSSSPALRRRRLPPNSSVTPNSRERSQADEVHGPPSQRKHVPLMYLSYLLTHM